MNDASGATIWFHHIRGFENITLHITLIIMGVCITGKCKWMNEVLTSVFVMIGGEWSVCASTAGFRIVCQLTKGNILGWAWQKIWGENNLNDFQIDLHGF